MNQEHGQGQEGETVGIRGTENKQNVYSDTDRGKAVTGASAGAGDESITPDRENSQEGAGNLDTFGGVIDQLIEDARKQMVKSQECIVWYREEVKEYEQKINNLMKLKELQQQQQEKAKSLQTK
jgi:hypothetical protein